MGMRMTGGKFLGVILKKLGLFFDNSCPDILMELVAFTFTTF